MAFNEKTAKYVNFKGLRLKDKSYEVGFDGLVEAININLSRTRRPSRRSGYAQEVEDTIDASWGDDKLCLYVSGTTLKYFDGVGTGTVRSDITEGSGIVAYRIGSDVYYSTGYETGVFNIIQKYDRTYGLAVPKITSVSAVSGSLPVGKYLVSAVYVRGDGQLSGAGIASVIELTSEGGISAVVPESQDPTIVYIDLYISTPNGAELFRANRAVNGASTIEYGGDIYNLQVPLRTQFKTAPPPFIEIDQFSSRLLFGTRNGLVYTDPFAYELVDLRGNFVPFGSDVTMIATVTSGCFVGTSTELWFLSGGDIKQASAECIDSHGVVPHTKRYVKGDSVLRGEMKDTLPFWVSKNGNICMGLPDGNVQYTTEKTVTIPEGISGTALFRQENGQNNYIAVINA